MYGLLERMHGEHQCATISEASGCSSALRWEAGATLALERGQANYLLNVLRHPGG